jgi:predicted nucleic acid-binding Zn ribbon protein
MSDSGFTSLKKALEMTLDRLGLGVGMANVVIHRAWPQVVGEEVARRSQPGLLRNGRLHVTVVDAIWLQQLTMLKPRILAGLESHLGSRMVLDIFFSVGTLSFPAPERQRIPRGRRDRLSPEQQEHVKAILGPVQDQECREVLGRILTKACESEESA